MPPSMPRAPRSLLLPLLLAAAAALLVASTAAAAAMGGPAASTTTTTTTTAAAAAAPKAVPPRPAAPASASSSASACPIGEDVALSSRRCAGARFLYHEVVQVRGERAEKVDGRGAVSSCDDPSLYTPYRNIHTPTPMAGPPGRAAGGRGDHRERARQPGQERRLPRGASRLRARL